MSIQDILDACRSAFDMYLEHDSCRLWRCVKLTYGGRPSEGICFDRLLEALANLHSLSLGMDVRMEGPVPREELFCS
jgi:hypothetical protein